MTETAYSNPTELLLDEELVRPADGFADLTGSRPAPTTTWRWINKGLNGHRLETVKVLGKTFTSRQAIRRFITAVENARCNQTRDETADRPDHVERRLADAGLA